jgi:DNA modification methylase
MARTISIERQALKEQAIILRKMGWTQQKIADQIGVPQRSLSRWFSQNGISEKVARTTNFSHYPKASNMAKPQFLSWCGKVENFTPENGRKFDLIIADPPWNISKPNSEISRTSRRTAVKKHFGFQDVYSTDEYLQTLGRWLSRLYELANTPNWCWFWCSYRYLSLIIHIAEQTGWDVHNWFLWAKTNPAPLMGANNFLQALEPVLILRKGTARFRFDNGHLPNYFVSPQVATGDRLKDFNGNAINLAQKPVPLLSLIVTWCTDQGQWILDAFAGSGSASFAALMNNRNCYAVELDQAQLTIIKGRLQREGLI